MDVAIARSARSLWLASVFFVTATPVFHAAQGQRLNAPLPTTVTGDVESFELSPDGSRIVYLAQQDQHQVSELYSVPVGGGFAVKLNGVPVENGDVLPNFTISPTNSHVVYVADQETDSALRLYGVPIDGSSPAIRLADAPASEGIQPVISPTGDHVAFVVELGANRFLCTVPIDGTSPAVLLGKPATQGSGWFQFSPDGQRLIFRGSAGGDFGLFSAPSDGSSAPLQLQGGQDGGIKQFEISPDGNRVVFTSDHAVPGEADLYSVPVLGGEAPVLLQGAIVPGGDVGQFEILPGSDRVVHVSRMENLTLGLFAVPIDGSTEALQLSEPGQSVGDVVLSADGARVLYEISVGGARQLWVVASDGSGAALQLVSSPDFLNDVAFSPLGTRAIYEKRGELFSVPVDGSAAPVRLHPGFPSGYRVVTFQVGVANGRLAYLANHEHEQSYELFTARIDGIGTPVRLNDAMSTNRDVEEDFQVSPDGLTVVYRADAEEYELIELFAATGAHPNTRLNGPITAATILSDINDFWVTPDGLRTLYRVGGHGVFSMPIQLGASATHLSELEAAGELSFTSDGATVFYNDHQTLFAWELHGGGAPRALLPSVIGFARLTSDDQWLVCVSDRDEEGVHDLFSVRLDGSEPPIRLNGPLVAGGDVSSFQISPDGSRVLYFADETTDDVVELFSAPIDGTVPSIRLNGGLVAGRDVESFEISPTSDRVLYRADQVPDNPSELYSALIAGGAAPIRLNTVNWAPGAYLVTAQGDRAVFQQDFPGPAIGIYVAPMDGSLAPTQLFHGDYQLVGADPGGTRVVMARTPELYSRVVDGSAPPVLLSSTFPSELRFLPGNDRIVYRANSAGLYTAPLDGHASEIRLDEPAVFATVQPDFLLAQAGRTAVYRADSLVNGRLELFSVDTRGGELPQRLNGPLPPGGQVLDNVQLARNGRVLYLADQDVDTQIELYLAVLPRANVLPAAPPVETVER